MEKSDLKFHQTREIISVTPSIPSFIFTWLWAMLPILSDGPCSASGSCTLSHLHSFSARIPSARKKMLLPLATALSSFYCPDPKADSVFSAPSFRSHMPWAQANLESCGVRSLPTTSPIILSSR